MYVYIYEMVIFLSALRRITEQWHTQASLPYSFTSLCSHAGDLRALHTCVNRNLRTLFTLLFTRF